MAVTSEVRTASLGLLSTDNKPCELKALSRTADDMPCDRSSITETVLSITSEFAEEMDVSPLLLADGMPCDWSSLTETLFAEERTAGSVEDSLCETKTASLWAFISRVDGELGEMTPMSRVGCEIADSSWWAADGN